MELWRYDALRKKLGGEQEKSKKELEENEHGVVMEEETLNLYDLASLGI